MLPNAFLSWDGWTQRPADHTLHKPIPMNGAASQDFPCCLHFLPCEYWRQNSRFVPAPVVPVSGRGSVTADVDIRGVRAGTAPGGFTALERIQEAKVTA